MARILYGIAGEGMGHATRSKPIIEHLLKNKHEVVIITSRKPYEFLKNEFQNVHNIHGMHISYKNNRARHLRTLIENTIRLPKGLFFSIRKLAKIIREFKPDIAITDFEPFTSIISRFYKIPVISIDNMHILTNCRHMIKKRHLRAFLTAKLIISSLVVKADYYLITTFFYPKITKKSTFLFPPVLRQEIREAKSTAKGHILVYQTSQTNKRIISVLKRVNRKFIVYGWNDERTYANIAFRKFNEKNFVRDLASSEGIITNGGFSTISEALYLGKPVLSEPIKSHFEQMINAIYVDKLGYGEFQITISADSVNRFISNLDRYRQNLRGYKREDNTMLFKKIDRLIKNLDL